MAVALMCQDWMVLLSSRFEYSSFVLCLCLDVRCKSLRPAQLKGGLPAQHPAWPTLKLAFPSAVDSPSSWPSPQQMLSWCVMRQ